MNKTKVIQILNLHISFRDEWSEWFIWPNVVQTVYFIFEELAEVGNAVTLNDGTFARSGRHKATEDDLSKELADLWLMLHTLFLVLNRENDQNATRTEVFADYIAYHIAELKNPPKSKWSLDGLAYQVSSATKMATGWGNVPPPSSWTKITDYSITISMAMACVASHPQFDSNAVIAVLDKWKQRAVKRKKEAL